MRVFFAGLAAGIEVQANQEKDQPDEVTQAYLREHYTKFEYRVPMRDGARLFTTVYAPKDDSGA